ncbi:MATH and LRR domain-containing protein PFE0570w-like [Melitaea cinxia]|uniref:MATH and LRR domain-containing protein PFE0570w-like n=1 Tax=Melitaea cinxia TaxID=113334 RepID=UPI001E274084|nr:MATH and LRR domain-containing protein PFE0570w-like [Melitaea cinxia]
MEYAVIEEANVPVEITELKDTESTEKFQKFIQELFEKNGILNDLRAYLRVHILDVLKSAETGDITPCQKNFTQRLELTFQAMNILITEYLLRLDLNYSLSVFTSEIPLSNMVFKFAKTLLKTNDDAISKLRFGESDIWKILNYLGIKCDSEHALKIVETYKSQPEPLLCCILKCIPIYHEPTLFEPVHSSEESISRDKNEGLHEDRMTFAHEISNKCKHYTVCEACQERYTRLKEKYKRKKIELEENRKASEANALNFETFMKNVDILERTLIDEMYEQLKTAYETEVDIIRDENENKIRRSIANHALQLQNYRDELEKSFAERHRQLGESVRQRQRFLCELAQRLAAVQAQVWLQFILDRLRKKADEKTHKIQMQDAEETLKNKCELMRRQIAEELKILQNNLETVKQERDDIDRQKAELENLKQIYNTNNILKEKTLKENEDLKRHYDLLKDEIAILRKCLENSKTPKYLVEKGTETESHVNNLNNGSVGSLKNDDERLKVSQVVNDFKKQKNVNFSQKYSEDHQRGSFNVEMTSETENTTIQHLREENERLKAFAKQQSEHIDRLTADRQRFQNKGTRPRTAPSTACNSYYTQSVLNYPCELGVQPRVLFPTDTIPFIGVVKNRQSDDNRRRLLTQWRRQRSSEESCKRNQANTSTNVQNNKQTDDASQPIVRETPAAYKPESPVKSALRDKSPNTVRKTKQKLRNNNLKEPTPPRERSPNATLREAKLRLRKLEIEAEAVQRSYLDYKKRQMEMKDVEDSIINIEDIKEIDKKQRKSSEKFEKNHSKSEKFVYKDSPETIKKDFDKYFREYQNVDIGKTHFCNLKAVIEKIKPIPESYSKLQDESKYNNINYLETPLIEFRKFYQTGNNIKNNERINFKPNYNNLNTDNDRSEETSTKLVDKVIVETSSHLKIKENNYKNNINQVSVKNVPLSTKLLENTLIETSSQLKFQENNKKDNTNDDSDVKNESQIDIKIQENKENNNNNQIKPSETEKDTNINPEFVHMKKSKEESLSQPNIVELNYTENKIDNNKVDTSKDKENGLPIEISNEKSATVLEETAETIDFIEVEKQKTDIEVVNEENINDDNLLIVEVENVRTTTNIGATESNQDMLVVVESSIDNNGLVLSETESTKEIIPTQMTIIVSPKEDSILKDIDKTNLSPEITKLSEHDVLSAIYHSDNNKISSLDLGLDENKLELELNSEKETQEYQDDFSADVDNYNSQSEYGNNSPISLPQTSENDNFWDS